MQQVQLDTMMPGLGNCWLQDTLAEAGQNRPSTVLAVTVGCTGAVIVMVLIGLLRPAKVTVLDWAEEPPLQRERGSEGWPQVMVVKPASEEDSQ
jgi:hypothetical protein